MQITFHQNILQFKQPAGTSRGVYRTRTVWYIKACDDAGHWGIGECAPLPDLSCDAMPDSDYEAVLAEACRLTVEEDGVLPATFLRPYPSILFGLETAIGSLKGCHQCGNPFQLFDSAFSRCETGIVINGLVWMGTYEEMMARMEEKLALGFHCIKIKIGAIDWEREISLIRALRERFPREVVEIRVDANGGFSPEVAMSRLHELSRYDIHSIEQPIRQHQWEAMAQLCRNTPIPIALDEELIGVNDPAEKARLLDTIRPQYIILKPSLHGGLSGSEEWIRLARNRGIGYWITSALESNVGLNAIAQWTAMQIPHSLPENMPQGLGTGQLFVDNYDAIHLSIEGERLWCGTSKDRAFEADYRAFVEEWNNDSVSVEVHTSGSTGIPMPLRVEKSRMCASARMTLSFLHIPRGATALLCMPLRYIAGKMMVVRAIEGGLRLLRQAPSATPDLTALPPIFFLAVTPMQALALLRNERQRTVFLRVPRIIIGGGAITPELHEALQRCEGEVYSTYGMTETLSHIAMRRLNGPVQSEWYTPLDGVCIRQNEVGCLVVEVPALCSDTLTTHDVCELRSDGAFRILGRTDNIISSGGIKLSLERLEDRLAGLGCPFQLTYVADALLGQALTLLYVASQDEKTAPQHKEVSAEEVIRAAIESRLDRYERPRHILRVDHLPTTETGKPARHDAHLLAEAMLSNANTTPTGTVKA